MTTPPRSARINAGPRTWALVREAYLSGETAQAVCARFGVKKDALRAQATRKGWTKRAYADALIDPVLGRMPRARRTAAPPPASGSQRPDVDPAAAPADPGVLAHAALREAGQALAEGRVADAATHLKLAEGLARLVAALPPPSPARTPEDRERLSLEAAETYRQDVWTAAERLARSLLADARGLPAIHTRAAFAWRAEHLGEEAAARDRAAAERGGWAARIYDETGCIRPPETVAEFEARLHGRRPFAAPGAGPVL